MDQDLPLVKATIETLIEELHPPTSFSLVTFSTNVHTVFPLQEMTPENKVRDHRNIFAVWNIHSFFTAQTERCTAKNQTRAVN